MAPIDPVLGGLIGTAASSGGNLIGTLLTNRKQEKLQREAWEREDTAVQRRVTDMRAAGINPLLAAGSAAQSSGPITLKAPEIEDFGGSYISGAQAKQAAKYQNEQIALMTEKTKEEVALMAKQKEVEEIKRAQAAHDLLLNIRRETRSNDNSGLVNQVVQGLDHIKGIFEKNKEGIKETVGEASNMAKSAGKSIVNAFETFTPAGRVYKFFKDKNDDKQNAAEAKKIEDRKPRQSAQAKQATDDEAKKPRQKAR